MDKKTTDRLQCLDYGSARWKIVYKLINTGRNRELLEDVPHMAFMDLSIVFQYIVFHDEDELELLLVHNVHMELWDVTVGNLYQDASKNTYLLMPYMARDITEHVDVVLEDTGMERYDPDGFREKAVDADQAYTLTTGSRTNGAACMLYPNLIRRFSDRLGRSLFILPLSVHELMILPYEYEGEEGARSLIMDINDTETPPDEILSYSLYYYDRDEYKLFIY